MGHVKRILFVLALPLFLVARSAAKSQDGARDADHTVAPYVSGANVYVSRFPAKCAVDAAQRRIPARIRGDRRSRRH